MSSDFQLECQFESTINKVGICFEFWLVIFKVESCLNVCFGLIISAIQHTSYLHI